MRRDFACDNGETQLSVQSTAEPHDSPEHTNFGDGRVDGGKVEEYSTDERTNSADKVEGKPVANFGQENSASDSGAHHCDDNWGRDEPSVNWREVLRSDRKLAKRILLA